MGRLLRSIGGPALFAGLTAAGAQVTVPLGQVPFTLQSLGVVLAGMLLGPGRGVGSALIYLIAGGLGLPVFADGNSGVEHLAGRTGGYLLGFVLTAWLAGIIAGPGRRSRIGGSSVGRPDPHDSGDSRPCCRTTCRDHHLESYARQPPGPTFRRALVAAIAAQIVLLVIGGIWFALATGTAWSRAGWTLLTLLPGMLIKGTAAGAVVWGRDTARGRRA